MYASSLVLFMFFNIIGSGVCTSPVNPFLCFSAVLGGKLMLTHVGSDISIEHDSILLTCLTSTGAVSGEGVNGDTMPAFSPVPRVVRAGPWLERSHHELLRQTGCLSTSWTRIQKEAAVVGFSSRCDTVICGNTILSPLETMGEKILVLQGQARVAYKHPTREMKTKTCQKLFWAQKLDWLTILLALRWV